ncbi:hypothetical protein LIER_02951 [Lithospermum erythrorhizon]|uniref:Uncharacterized protein n=1 Tax=Lithospermum erythrorhizon TaxID=34254 RepID=A0AAV3NRW4_LITER
MVITTRGYDGVVKEANEDFFMEIDEYPGNQAIPVTTDESHPLSERSCTPSTVSSSSLQGGVSQPADDQGEDSGILPVFIQHSPPVPFTNTEL